MKKEKFKCMSYHTSIYEYFVHYKETPTRIASLITDNDFATCIPLENNEYTNDHREIIFNAIDYLYPKKNEDTYRIIEENDILLFGMGEDISINIPERGYISEYQYEEVMNIINQINDWQKRNAPLTQRYLTIFDKDFPEFNLEEIRKHISKFLKEEDITFEFIDEETIKKGR